ncbi:phosphoserine transaminase [Quadrisphaera setariae]|uniref:phosphoserine transaminase n=1 Tax=Quadrisphaera setariae TaxID=2593304 RepID=A0A5C8Z467_9ACTN|nr:phosphoserine transaminase [Quadrisphaera setariae]
MHAVTSSDTSSSGTPAAGVPTITVPPSLLPRDGRFGSGPSKVRDDQVAAIAGVGRTVLGTSHRQLPVRSLVARTRAGMTDLFSLPDGYEVVLGNGGSTTFWDVATTCLVRERAQHLVLGAFSEKFAKATAAAPFLAAPDVRRSEPFSAPTAEAEPGVDAYAYPHNETSTGVVLPVVRPSGLAEDDDALVLVDATSAAGGVPVDASRCDAYYFAPQKSFGSDGGLWLALLSPAAIARAEELQPGRWVPGSLDLLAALAESQREQTVNTPAVATLLMLAEQVEWMLDRGGLEWAAARSAESASRLYEWAEASQYARPAVRDRTLRSPVVGTIDLDPSVDAAAVRAVLRANGVVDVEPYRGLGGNQLRVGMFPAVDPHDVSALTACVDHVVSALS